LEKRYDISNPTDKMRTPRVKKKIVPSLSKTEIQQLFNQPLGKRDYAILRTLVGTGIRVGECINIKWQDIGEDILKVSGKTGGRNVPLNPEIRDALLALKNGHKPADPVFWGAHPNQPLRHAGFLNLVRRAFKNAGIEGKRASPHTLRHSFARNWITQGGDVASLKDILGHSSLAITQGYLALSSEDLISKNKKYNPLLSLVDDRLTPNADSITRADDRINSDEQQLSLCYTIVK
jgi:integrase/recombinase XerD